MKVQTCVCNVLRLRRMFLLKLLRSQTVELDVIYVGIIIEQNHTGARCTTRPQITCTILFDSKKHMLRAGHRKVTTLLAGRHNQAGTQSSRGMLREQLNLTVSYQFSSISVAGI